jgi:hypothetical protein
VAYSKQRSTWVDWPDLTTKVRAQDMNGIESGIAATATVADAAIPKPIDPTRASRLAYDGTNWVSRLEEINVSDYGALVDGSTDDHTAVAAAIAALPANGGILKFPPGECVDGTPHTVTGKPIGIRGAGRSASIWRYSGGSQQPFFTFGGGNQGSFVEHICMTGRNADPVIDIRSTPTYTYNSLLSLDDCFIGYAMRNGVALTGATYKAYSGITVKCDVFHMSNCMTWGRNYGLRLRSATTDAFFTNSSFSSLPEGGESRGIGFWCEDAAAGEYFDGTVNLTNCSFGAGTEAACLLRSIANVYGFYCESSPLPLKLVLCHIKLFGGKIASDSGSCNYLIDADTCNGVISYPYLSAPASITNWVRAINSPFALAWDISINKNAAGGTIPGTLVSIDQPAQVFIPGATLDVASTGTVTLPLYSNYFNITGTTNITSITASWPGRVVFLKFAGVLTLTDGSNLKLGGNFVTTADDVIGIVTDGTNWYQIAPGSVN